MRWVLWTMIGVGCELGQGEIDCEESVMRDADGNVDPCDLAACEACNDACDGPCLVLESLPPQYACEDGSSFTASDECPDWEPPAR